MPNITQCPNPNLSDTELVLIPAFQKKRQEKKGKGEGGIHPKSLGGGGKGGLLTKTNAEFRNPYDICVSFF